MFNQKRFQRSTLLWGFWEHFNATFWVGPSLTKPLQLRKGITYFRASKLVYIGAADVPVFSSCKLLQAFFSGIFLNYKLFR